MNFFEAVKTCFAKYVNFNGRARRSEYWWYALFLVILSVVAALIDSPKPGESGTVGTIVSLATLLPSIAVAVRRMHDVGKSGWFCLIPIYNIVLACTNGEVGDNEYGSDPKGGITENEIDQLGTNTN